MDGKFGRDMAPTAVGPELGTHGQERRGQKGLVGYGEQSSMKDLRQHITLKQRRDPVISVLWTEHCGSCGRMGRLGLEEREPFTRQKLVKV